jgi:hypothetical protein
MICAHSAFLSSLLLLPVHKDSKNNILVTSLATAFLPVSICHLIKQHWPLCRSVGPTLVWIIACQFKLFHPSPSNHMAILCSSG